MHESPLVGISQNASAAVPPAVAVRLLELIYESSSKSSSEYIAGNGTRYSSSKEGNIITVVVTPGWRQRQEAMRNAQILGEKAASYPTRMEGVIAESLSEGERKAAVEELRTNADVQAELQDRVKELYEQAQSFSGMEYSFRIDCDQWRDAELGDGIILIQRKCGLYTRISSTQATESKSSTDQEPREPASEPTKEDDSITTSTPTNGETPDQKTRGRHKKSKSEEAATGE